MVQDFQDKYQKEHTLISELSMKDLKHQKPLVDSPLTSRNNHNKAFQKVGGCEVVGRLKTLPNFIQNIRSSLISMFASQILLQ